MAIDFGRAARGIATGYIGAKVADTAAQDELNREFILQATNQYFNVDKPQFIADEKKREANINLIATDMSPVYANYADARGITLSDSSTKQFMGSIKDLSKEDQYKIESTIISRKKERTQTFDERNKFITDQFKNLKGGPGSMNITNMFFPNEGQDIAEVGVKQGNMLQSTADLKSVRQIEGTGSGIYNFDEHGTERREFINFFNGTFRNPVSGAPEINVGPSDARYELQQSLKEGYEEAQKNGFIGGEYLYMMNKFVDTQFKNQGIAGYPTGFPESAQTTSTAAEPATTTTETKAVPGDNKKFDANKTGVKENVEPEVVTTDAASGSSATLINDFREFRVRVNDSPSLSEDEKINKIEQAKERLKQRLIELGTFNESILRQL